MLGLDEYGQPEGARRMVAAALAAVDAYVAQRAGGWWCARVTLTQSRRVVPGAAPVEVGQPRVNDCRGDEGWRGGPGQSVIDAGSTPAPPARALA